MIHFRFIAGILIASVLLGVTKIDFFRIDKPLDPAVLPPNQAVERRSLISEAPSQPASHDITQENSLVYSADIMEGLIGVDENSPVDDPFDNVFHFFLENAPTQTGTVWLQYQLTGVQDHTAVARSINSRQAVGGYLIQNTEEWSFQRERIDPSWLRDGDNVIRFSTHTAIDYTYQVKEVQIVVEDKGGSDRAIVVNQPSNCYFRDQAYLKGFIIGDQSGTPKMFLDGQQINLTDGEFEYLVQKPEGAPDEWQSEIVVQYPDGEEKRTTVHFRSQLHPDMVLPFAQKQTAYTQLLGTDGGELDLPGAKLSVPPRALETEKSILAIPLRTVDLPPLEPDMVNVTKNQAGFRFLPDGMQFASEASLQLDYDPSLIPEGYTADDIRTYFFEEKSRRWIVLKRDSIDEQFSHIISSTSHFTDYINGIIKVPESPRTNAYTPTFIKDLKAADPSTGVIPIEPPAANNMGTANLQYPIKLPAGRLGMQPQVVLRYNSNGDNGWTGLGWECSFSSIGIETRWGVPRYDADLETETYIFDGMQLAPVAHRDDFEPRSTGDKQFFPRVESNFQKIIRHGQNPKNYWWEVIDKEGTRSFFGGRPSSGVDANAVLKDNFGNIAHWAIVETRDLNDNFIRYHYDRVQDPGIPGGVVPGFQLYPRRITYTGNGSNEGKYQVRFVRDQELGENKRPDVSIDARLGFKQVTAALLRKIEVSFNGGLVRSYELEYIEGAFYKTLLSSIIEKDKNGQTFYKHSFEYYDEVRQGNGYQPYKALQNWEVPDEELQGNISNTKQDFTAEVSAIGGSESSNSSIGGAVTFGPPILCGSKEVSVGVNFSSGEGESKGIVILVDINGDNLPDKVFRKNGALFFQPNLSGASSGMNEFGSAQLISGIDHFSQSNSNTSSFGWEANFFFYVGKSESDSESEATTYFADFNGDGLIDVAQDNEVYFNSLDSNGDPAFIPQSDQTPNPIIAGAALDPGLIEVDPQEKENLISKYPLHDVVRVWRAPYEGVITIRDSIKRIPPQTPAGINYAKKDTLKMSIQVGGDEIWSKSILANDYSVYELELPNISVDTGTQVYFRLQSVFNGAYDEILSDPQIQYSTIPDSVYEANGMQVNSYKASEDFLVASPQMVTMPFSGKVRVGGEFVKPVTSDSLTLLVVINRNSVDSIVYSKIFPWSDSLIYQLDTLIEIESEDDLSIKVVAPTNVEWSEISIFPQVYYVEAWDSTGQMIDVNGTNDSHKFVFYPAVGYSMLNEVFRRTEAFITPDSMILNVEPLINFKQGILSGQNTPNVSGQVTLSVKSLNKLYARETFQFTIIGFSGGLSYPFPPTISVPVGEDELIFVEYHFNDRNLLDSVQLNATVDGIPSSQYTVGLFSNFPEGKLLLGPLYRGWGQFVYNGNREWADQEIDENELKLNPALSEAGNIPSKNDIDNIEDPNELDSLYNPAYARFIVMIADPKNNMWRGYDDRTWVKALEMSSSRMGRDDVSLDFSMPASGTGLAAPNKLTRSNSKSWSYGGNLPPFVPSLSLSVSYSTSSTTSETIIDVADMNGDRYPDILGKNKIQYTTPEGGRTASGVAHQFSENHIAEGDSWSLGLGGSFAAASTPNSSAPGEGSPKSSVSGPANLFSSMFKCEKAPQTASKAIGLSISPNQSFGKNDDETKHSWLDVNGDGLPDKVFINGNVALNLGYRFAQAEQWGYSAIRKGESEDYSGGSGLGINIGQLSFSAGFGLTRTDNIVKESLQDVNGDGLIDIVKLGDPISVNLNTGNGFTNDLIFWNDANKIETGSSTGESKNIAGTFCIHLLPFLPVVKICGSLNYSDGTGVSKETFQISDVNGDGFPDLLSSSNDGQLNVRPSAIGRTNLLKKVTRPFDSCYFTLTYDRMGNTFEMPQSQWVMTSTAMYDGFFGDGVDWMKYAFEYEGGNYNRREREFYGFHTVKTIQLDAGENDESYRRIVHTYDDSTYYTKGLLLRELTLDANGNKYLETINTYEKIDRFTGQPHPGPALDDAGAVFPRLIKTEKFFYEGVSTPGLQTVFTFVYDEVGNVVEYADFGDNSPDDLLRAFIEYHDNDTKYIKSIPKSISITTPEGEIRYREADMDEYGNVTQIRQYLQGGEAAVYDLSYHDNGNLKRITRPTNHNGERLWFEYEYDDQVQIYVTKVSDAYGYTSSSVYEYLFGQLLETTDINSQKTTYTIDNRGRVTTITGPYELASGKPYTIAFEFNTDVPVPYAKTKHYDPAHNSDIETITFIDGLLRPIQVKKTGSLFIDKNLDDEKVMTVSGRVIFDAFGREVESYFPTTEPDNPALNIVFNSNFDNIPPTRKVYDVLDRTLAVVLPDGTTTSASYGIEEDNGGNTTFKTTESDGLGNKKESYTDIRGRVLAKKDNGPNGDIWTSFHYNLLGELLETTDHDGNKTKYTYDWLGRRLTEDSPVSGQMEMRYDLVGNLTHKITPNIREVNPDSGAIRFTYQLERLIQVDYPESYQNMVRYTYGEPGAEFNRAGRLYLQEDASGGQEFFYGPLGEIVKNIRTVLISNIQITTYVSEYRYDTWNRIDSLIYPDGEVVKYHYNQAGKLESMTGAKGSHEYVYIDKLGYDKFEQRIFLRYGNGTETSYTYEPERRRLSAMDVSDAGGWEFMKNRYTYDAVSNILSISNSMQMQSGSIGGPSSHSFEYDNLYRLIRANGTWSGPVSNHEYSLEMEYSDLGDILRKNQVHLYNGLTQFETTYEHVYQYEDDRPHILTKIDERDYTFDSNGNLTSCIRHNIHHNRRFYGWDEENRLKDVWDDGYLSRYTYDASGERVVKSHGGVQVAYENSAPVGMINHRDNFTAYVSPYLIARGLSYTKFYYIEDQRFLSKIGSGYFLSPLPESPGDYVTAGNIDYRERMKLLAEADSLGFPAPPTPGNPPVPSFSLPAYRQDQPNHFAYDIPRYANENVPPGFNLKNGDEFEDNAYFFHPDHIGSTSYLTNFNGKLRQHVEYFPFGEILMDEHSTNDPLQPYLFTGKELDMETGLYYFGARYYDPELSVWMSVDPMAEKYPGWSPYNYTLLNPVKLVDPDGNFPVETFWDIGNVIVNIGRGVFHELKGNREKANQAWTDLAIDAGAMAIPYLPAGVSKIKYADDVIDATKTIDKTTDAIKATEKAGDGQKIYQTYTKTNPKTGEVYTGRTSGTKSPEENVRLRDRNHHMNEEGFAPAVLDKSSSNRDAIRGREQQLIDLNGGAKSQGGTSGNKIRAISPKNEKANQYLNAAKREFD